MLFRSGSYPSYPIPNGEFQSTGLLDCLTEDIEELISQAPAWHLDGETGNEIIDDSHADHFQVEEEHHHARVWKIRGFEAEEVGICDFVVKSRDIGGFRDYSMTATNLVTGMLEIVSGSQPRRDALD